MKTKIFLAALLLSSLLMAQPNLTQDSIVVKASNDTVYVWDFNAWEQCGFELDYTVEIMDSVITITQIDSAMDATTCSGYHNFVVPVLNLSENKYRIDIFRKSLYQENRFIKSVRFEYHHPGWEENIILFPDSVFLSYYSETDSCYIINESNQSIYLDSIYNKSFSSYFCIIKKDNKYVYYSASQYKRRDSLNVLLNPDDTVTFIIKDVDVCPICKKENYEYLRDTLVFVFISDSNQTAEKLLLLGSDIPADVEDVKTNDMSFYLSQNYPNPFNPSTKIKYSIPQYGFVTLKVYDILGRVIATLVNEEKRAGNYEVNFHANNLSSGIYFYRIEAGGFTDTKKFILLR